jgi:hypothetical protein
MNLIQRAQQTQKTVDIWKGRPFSDGKFDCVQMVKAHARHLGQSLKVPRYHDVEEAAAALREMGHKSLGEALDARFHRIMAAQILVGDIVESLGSNGFSSLMVAVGNGRTLGFHEDIPHCDILQPLIISGAWRIGKLG